MSQYVLFSLYPHVPHVLMSPGAVEHFSLLTRGSINTAPGLLSQVHPIDLGVLPALLSTLLDADVLHSFYGGKAE